jgi:hypothetical protein
MDADQGGAERDADWMSDVMGTAVNVPEELYAQEASASLRAAEHALGREIAATTERASRARLGTSGEGGA